MSPQYEQQLEQLKEILKQKKVECFDNKHSQSIYFHGIEIDVFEKNESMHWHVIGSIGFILKISFQEMNPKEFNIVATQSLIYASSLSLSL